MYDRPNFFATIDKNDDSGNQDIEMEKGIEAIFLKDGRRDGESEGD